MGMKSFRTCQAMLLLAQVGLCKFLYWRDAQLTLQSRSSSVAYAIWFPLEVSVLCSMYFFLSFSFFGGVSGKCMRRNLQVRSSVSFSFSGSTSSRTGQFYPSCVFGWDYFSLMDPSLLAEPFCQMKLPLKTLGPFYSVSQRLKTTSTSNAQQITPLEAQ